MASTLVAMASTLVAMASNLVAKASNLIAMASTYSSFSLLVAWVVEPKSPQFLNFLQICRDFAGVLSSDINSWQRLNLWLPEQPQLYLCF